MVREFIKHHLNPEPVKFIIAGSISSVSALITIFILVSGFHLWPVLGTILASGVSGAVGFNLHKHWTFRNKSPRWRKQAIFFLGLILGNLSASAGLMYLLNDILGLWYFLAQVLIILSLATVNFLLNKFIIFKNQT